MEIKEAIENLKCILELRAFGDEPTESIKMAIFALEKQEGKKPHERKQFANIFIGDCPVCGDPSNSEFEYCCICGQKIDWSE